MPLQQERKSSPIRYNQLIQKHRAFSQRSKEFHMSTAPFPVAVSTDRLDQSPLPLAASEELAGPPLSATAPVSQLERVNSIDVLRGFSLMGILIMNITAFAFGHNYSFPLSTIQPVFSGPHWKVNTTVWFLRWVFAEGKMRGLFSLLFGAGVILLTARAESRGAGIRTADIYTRRNLWLLLFGAIHCYFIWDGDILYAYATSALLFLFPLRHLKVKPLLWAAGIILLIDLAVMGVLPSVKAIRSHRQAVSAQAAQLAHTPLTDDQTRALATEKESEEDWRYPVRKEQKDIADHRGYVKGFLADAPSAFRYESSDSYPAFAGDWLGMMLSLKRSTKLYAITAGVCLTISWSITFAGCYIAWSSHFDHIKTLLALYIPYDIARVTGVLGNAALILLLIRFGIFKDLLARVGNVGQMALSNYLLTSLTMKFLYVWSPLHWYGAVEYYKIYYAVGAMWIFNLTFSTLWLRYFRFGPFEWCLLSLTYWKPQPMRLAPSTPAAPLLEAAA